MALLGVRMMTGRAQLVKMLSSSYRTRLPREGLSQMQDKFVQREVSGPAGHQRILRRGDTSKVTLDSGPEKPQQLAGQNKGPPDVPKA